LRSARRAPAPHRGAVARGRAQAARAPRHAVPGAVARRGRPARPRHRRRAPRCRAGAARACDLAGVQAVSRSRWPLPLQAGRGRARAVAQPWLRIAARRRPARGCAPAGRLCRRGSRPVPGRGRGCLRGAGRAGRAARGGGRQGMNQLAAMPDLALVLFAPWFLILSVLFWVYPRQPRNAKRRLFDIAALLLSLLAFVATLRWAHGYADPKHGGMWPQILATSAGYGVYLLALTIAVLIRRLLFRK